MTEQRAATHVVAALDGSSKKNRADVLAFVAAPDRLEQVTAVDPHHPARQWRTSRLGRACST